MNLDPLTVKVIIAITVAAFGYTAWTLWKRGYKTTISWTMLTASKKFPVIAYAFGFVSGHLLWENTPPEAGLTYQCSKSGIEYVVSASGIAPHVDGDGNPVPCNQQGKG